jgi:hypothetical protein
MVMVWVGVMIHKYMRSIMVRELPHNLVIAPADNLNLAL